MNVETFDYKGYNVKINTDDDPGSPREWDNLGTMVCAHSRYNLGDIQVGGKYELNKPHFSDVQELIDFVSQDDVIALPLYLYDHSGITMNTGGFHDPWDSGQVGFIYVTKEKIKDEYGWTRITPKRRATIEEYLRNEVQTYDDYLTGNVFGYIVDDNEGNHVDSCWGFYGKDYCIQEAKSIVDWHVEHTDNYQYAI